MLTTFDRYLLKRYLHAFAILFMSMYGLFMVIDGFTNVDAFQNGKEHSSEIIRWMAEYYVIQSIQFFAMVAPMVSVVSVMVVFALLQKNSELHPILAAGIPVYRLIVPIVLGTIFVNGIVILNQEYVIPRIAHRLQGNRSEDRQDVLSVEPIYDHKTRILIGGKSLSMGDRRIINAEFILPPHEVATELTTLKAPEAAYLDANSKRPGGWLLRDAQIPFEKISLTEDGKPYVRQTNQPNDIFIVTDVTVDQLSNRSKNYQYLSTSQLLRRIHNPSTGLSSLRGQTLFFHARLVKPLINILAIFVVVPLVLRKESRGLVTNMAVCATVMGAVNGLSHFSSYLGQVNLIPPDLAAWSPAIITGAIGAWLSGIVQS